MTAERQQAFSDFRGGSMSLDLPFPSVMIDKDIEQDLLNAMLYRDDAALIRKVFTSTLV